MDLFKQKYIVEGLIILIEDNLDMGLGRENAEARLDTAGCALQTAQKLDYFPKRELERLNYLYSQFAENLMQSVTQIV